MGQHVQPAGGDHLARHPRHWTVLSGPGHPLEADELRAELLAAVEADPADAAPVATVARDAGRFVPDERPTPYRSGPGDQPPRRALGPADRTVYRDDRAAGYHDTVPERYRAHPVSPDAPPGPRPPRWETPEVYRTARPYLGDAKHPADATWPGAPAAGPVGSNPSRRAYRQKKL